MGTFSDKVTSAMEDPGPLKLFLYGEPGSGKTVFCCGAPRPLLVDCENGRRSLLNHPELAGVPVVKANTYKEAEAVIAAASAGDSFFDDIDTIIIDTITRLQQKQLVEELKAAVEKNSSRHPFLPSQNEYNINNRMMERFVLSLIERTNKNIIIVGHVKEDKDDEGQTVLTRPNTSPGVVGTLTSLMDGVFYMSSNTLSTGETTRKLRVLPSAKLKAKNRLGSLPVELINPTFKQVLDAAESQRDIARKWQETNGAQP